MFSDRSLCVCTFIMSMWHYLYGPWTGDFYEEMEERAWQLLHCLFLMIQMIILLRAFVLQVPGWWSTIRSADGIVAISARKYTLFEWGGMWLLKTYVAGNVLPKLSGGWGGSRNWTLGWSNFSNWWIRQLIAHRRYFPL